MLQRVLQGNPDGLFLHTAILNSCRRNPEKIALVDTSITPSQGGPRRITYAQYGDMVERVARNLAAAGIKPGEVIGIYLSNCWEYAVVYHAITLAGAIPTLLNPSYREREVRYQLETSEAVLLISDGALISAMNLSGLPRLRGIYATRASSASARPCSELLHPTSARLPQPEKPPEETIAALPFSSGTTGLPKGVMLSHRNLVVNVFQIRRPGEAAGFREDEAMLCFLPLYHIYGLNVILNPILMLGGTLVLMPRFDVERACEHIARENITYLPLVPPTLNAFCRAAEQGIFPRQHRIRAVKSGAAPLAPQLAHRFTDLTGIRVAQGYGMTEASPVTHLGFIEDDTYRPESIGREVALTDCRLLDGDKEAGPGELVMRGPQFMMGYWKSPQATVEVMREGWYWSGDVARRDAQGLYYIVDRRKEMIKYKGFPVAPAEVEALLLEHPAVRDCGVVGRADPDAGEVPCAFVVLRQPQDASAKLEAELCGYVGERLTSYKQPRQVRFVDSIPRNPSGKILRRELRALL